MTRKLNKKQWNEIRLALDRGESKINLAKEYGVSRNAIYLYSKRNWQTKPNKFKRFLSFLYKLFIKWK